MDIKLRELRFEDVFKFSRIIKKTGISKEIGKLFVDVTGKSSEEKDEISKEKGLQLGLLIFENLDNAKNEIYSFLSDLSGIEKEKIKDLTIEETMELFMAFGKLEGLDNFFKSVATLMKQQQ